MDFIQIAQLATHIWTTLGPGFSESVYHNAFEMQLIKLGVSYETGRVIPIVFDGDFIGSVCADIVLNNETVIELKSVTKLNDSHRHQIGIYMDHGQINSGILINFPSTASSSIEYQTFTSSV